LDWFAELRNRSIIGEMSCLMGTPASATVITTARARLLAFEIGKLNDFLNRNVPVRQQLEHYFANQVGAKLIQANTALSANPQLQPAAAD